MSHWVLLLFADRVDMAEELLLDVARGEILNVPRQLGLKSALRFNRKGVAKKAAFVGLGVAALVLLSRRRKS